MNYYIREIQTNEGVQKTAGIKARDDVERILSSDGFREIIVETDLEKRKKVNSILGIYYHYETMCKWNNALKKLKKNDYLIMQFPVINHTIFLNHTIRGLQKRGVKVVLLIHDLETIRSSLRKETSSKQKIRLNLEEKSILKGCNYIIAHNFRMVDYLNKTLGIDKDKLISLEIFDYLIPGFDENFDGEKINKESPIIVAGTLRLHKAKYVYDLPENINFNLYGVGYEGKEKQNIKYYGAFMPDELPFAMKGSFGLVWDGESANTCSGILGEYLKINNPHKTSLYLASGIPVVIWKKAALAEFVRKNNCGIVVDSIEDINQMKDLINENDYLEMKRNVMKISKQLRSGYYLLNAVKKIMKCEEN